MPHAGNNETTMINPVVIPIVLYLYHIAAIKNTRKTYTLLLVREFLHQNVSSLDDYI